MNERVKKFVTNPVYICLVILSASVIGLCIAVGLHNNSRKSTESDLEEAVSVLQNSDLNTITGGVLYLQDRGDGIKDLVVTSNLQMIGSNDNGVTYKTGRIVFNHMEDDIHLDKAKAMIARVPHDSGHSDTYQYEPIVMIGVAAQMLSGKDINRLNTPYITQQLEAQNFPVGSGGSVTNSLLRYQQLLIQQARSNLRSKYQEPVTFNNINYVT